MAPWSNLVDMEMDDDDKLDAVMPCTMARPDYPPGLNICLTHRELEKLGLEADCEVGSYLDLRVFASVTNVHKDENGCRVELRIEKMAAENEMDEDQTPEK